MMLWGSWHALQSPDLRFFITVRFRTTYECSTQESPGEKYSGFLPAAHHKGFLEASFSPCDRKLCQNVLCLDHPGKNFRSKSCASRLGYVRQLEEFGNASTVGEVIKASTQHQQLRGGDRLACLIKVALFRPCVKLTTHPWMASLDNPCLSTNRMTRFETLTSRTTAGAKSPPLCLLSCVWRLDVKVVSCVRHVRELGQDVGRHHHIYH